MFRHIVAILSEDVPLPAPTPGPEPDAPEDHGAPVDPLPKKLRDTVNSRLKNYIIVCVLSAVVVFLIVQGFSV